MKRIVSDILKGKDIDNNLVLYKEKYNSANNKYGLVRFAINYYTYYSMVSEDEGMLEYGNKESVDVINGIVSDYLLGKNIKENISKLEQIRNDIVDKMQDLTIYVDKFNIYEFALNRVEFRFKQSKYENIYSDENITRKIMQFIFEDEDSVTVNNKISQIIGQVPVKLTKNKFYEMVSNGLSIYNGGTRESLKNFLYMLKTSAMLINTDTMAENYPYLDEVFKEFEEINFKEIDENKYNEMSRLLVKVSEYIDDLVSTNMTLQGLINDLLIVLYTYEDSENNNVVNACNEIIGNTNMLFDGKFIDKSIEEVESMFIELEGVQEELYPLLSACDVTDEIKECYQENLVKLGLMDVYENIYKLPKLNSDSTFAQLEMLEDNALVDDAYLENEKEKLFETYTDIFSKCDKMIKKAIMSATLAELPVFFNNISELQDFIYNNLSMCNDKAEKIACIEIFNDIMEV